MLEVRIMTVMVVLPLLLAAMFLLPNTWWNIALVAPLLVAGHEWARLADFGRGAEAAFLTALLAGCLMLWLIAVPAAQRPGNAAAAPERAVFAVAVAFWCVIAPCWLWLKIVVRQRLALAVVGLVVLLPTWLALARLQHDAWLLLQLLAVIWIADSAAYFRSAPARPGKASAVHSPPSLPMHWRCILRCSRRAICLRSLPDSSAWWRSVLWGTCLNRGSSVVPEPKTAAAFFRDTAECSIASIA
ncbi:MAG: phosphatidate cytidylyltransferase [Betaproteobacteria bacterium]|nr:phosphatidate cytidylyltransferase [Betaproteobacteria bacterium]